MGDRDPEGQPDLQTWPSTPTVGGRTHILPEHTWNAPGQGALGRQTSLRVKTTEIISSVFSDHGAMKLEEENWRFHKSVEIKQHVLNN